MATHSIDYDRVLDAPESRIPDDQFECSQCGDVVHVECRTELELQLDACSEECLASAIAELKASAARSTSNNLRHLNSMRRIAQLAAGINGGADRDTIYRTIGVIQNISLGVQ